MDIQQMSFRKLKEQHKKREGLVLLGTGGDLQDWIKGVPELLKEEGIVSKEVEDSQIFSEVIHLTTTKGRHDLVMLFQPKENPINMGKLAMWRLRFGNCSWLSDYFNNFAGHHKR